MFGELKNLDRNYLVAYVLPATVLIIFTLLLLSYESIRYEGVIVSHDELVRLANDLGENEVWTLGSVTLLTWWVAATLQAVNNELLLWVQGWPAKELRLRERRRKRRLDEFKNLEAAAQKATGSKQEALRWRLAASCPLDVKGKVDENRVLAYEFGNTVQAAVTYPNRMYRIDATAAWPRLENALPAEYRRAVEGAKAQVDFMVNLRLVWWILLAESLVLAVLWRSLEYWLFALGAVVCILILNGRTRAAAKRWADAIMAAFDLGRHELRRQLGIEAPPSPAAERDMWESLSKSWLRRLPP